MTLADIVLLGGFAIVAQMFYFAKILEERKCLGAEAVSS
jgi:hypothetical protein